MTVQIYELLLEDDGSPSKERSYIRLPAPVEPYVLRFSIDAGSTASKNGTFFTNFPLDGSDYVRNKWHQQQLPKDLSRAIQINLDITKAGSYHFYIEYTASDSTRKRSAVGAFTVDPLLYTPLRSSILNAENQALAVGKGGVVGQNKIALPLDGLVIQSVISKWLGPISQWDKHLDLCRDRGYNMLHFVPLQQRGESGSPYSIWDQLSFDDALFDKKLDNKQKETAMRDMIAKIRSKWGILSLTDIVWNHTANNSPWLQDHPESGYTPKNSPHLQAALEVDTAILEMSASLAAYKLPTTLSSEGDLMLIVDFFKNSMLPKLRLWEYYVIDVKSATDKFEKAWEAKKGAPGASLSGDQVTDDDLPSLNRADAVKRFMEKCLPADWELLAGRFNIQINLSAAVSFFALRNKVQPGEASSKAKMVEEFTSFCNDLNVNRYNLFNDDVKAICDNLAGRAKYERLEEHGPKLGEISDKSPIMGTYFTRLPKNEKTAKHDPKSLALANNGWIWNADPSTDFASNKSRAYLRRQVIVWGDCVKLRYGSGPSDNPFLWEHMTRYTEQLAAMFDGFRIDNCHSTPIHVGAYLLDAARRKNPNMYVCAELFTGSEEMDLKFVKELGINSLIREAMNGSDPKDMSRLLYNYGVGKPIGSMDGDCLTETGTIKQKSKEVAASISQLQGSVPHAFLMDCTHDNESPLSKRTAEDALPTGSLVTFAWAAIGSNRGFDDLYPKLLDLVGDNRKYEIHQDTNNGIGSVKRVLNHLHTEMAVGGYVEGHLHQEGDYIISHRMHPKTHKGFITVAHTAFPSSTGVKDRGHVAPIELRGSKATYILGYSITIESTEDVSTKTTFAGLKSKLTPIDQPQITEKDDLTEIIVPAKFPPGSVMVFATWMPELTDKVDDVCVSGAAEAFKDLTVEDLNVVLFRADGEERDATGGDGCYAIPDMSPLVYCGLEGWMHPLRWVMRTNDLGHPLCSHLRNGCWAMDYIVNRLDKQIDRHPHLAKVSAWFKKRFEVIRHQVPSFMRPKYFAMVINTAYKAARDQVFARCSPFIQDGHNFTKALALVSVQMNGIVQSASLDPVKVTPSLAAGLPHFAAGWARTWGRDVFISLRGLFLTTGLWDQARLHILAFCSTLKHGLIPNLLDSIRSPRYNSRDSPWWMLQNIQDYVKMAPEGVKLLSVPVKRRFPKDDTWVAHDDSKAYSYESTVAEIIQEILQRHASGIHFREYNAGPNLDMQMKSEGFDIDIEVDWESGLILGGSAFNCGTWMDKMGESEKNGTKGLPGTPRDGAPVEITGLLMSTLCWVDELQKAGKFPFKGVERKSADGKTSTITYKQWADLLQKSFEKYYYVPSDPKQDAQYRIDSALVGRRGIYKDVYGSGDGRERSDYQLRPNFPIAMSVAPQLFDPKHALEALQVTRKTLLGPLGMATLDPADEQYEGNYDNSNDGDNRRIAKGWNYHQGPEWVWPLGYYLRAYLHFDLQVGAGKKDKDETIHQISSMLMEHRKFIRTDAWAGLPELTNKNGAYCHDSCRTQAWSSSTLLDVLDDISKLE